MFTKRETVTLTTAADGSVIDYSTPVNGRVLSVRYVKTDFADGVDFAITTETSGQQIWDQDNVNASATKAPRQAVHNTAGVAAEYATGFAIVEPIVVADERIKISITNGGATKSGTFHITIG
jgi:hypothetical protein